MLLVVPAELQYPFGILAKIFIISSLYTCWPRHQQLCGPPATFAGSVEYAYVKSMRNPGASGSKVLIISQNVPGSSPVSHHCPSLSPYYLSSLHSEIS